MTAEMDDRTANAAAPPAETNQSLVERAYQALRAKAIDFEFRPGEAVKVLALSRQLDLSRTPVKEALNRLVTEGLFEATDRGFVARTPDVDEVVDLYEMRTILETAAFRLACDRARPDDVTALARWWSTVNRGYADLTIAEITRIDEGFHDRIAGMAGNRELRRELGRVCARIRFFRSIDLDYQSYRAPFYDDHVAIVEALRARDVAGGQEIIARHIAISRERAVEVIKEALARIFARRGTERG